MTISSHFLSFLVFGSCIASLAFGGPTSDVHLTEENALDGDQLDFHEFHPTPQKMAEDVAGAFVKGLEDSIAGIADIFNNVFRSEVQRCYNELGSPYFCFIWRKAFL
jgi:hypothetical protein